MGAMSPTQRLATRILPQSWADAMEAESRAWIVQCKSCGFERSVWDVGGIRWKALGSKWTFGRCPNCGKLGWHHVAYRGQPEPSDGA